jgi:signal transduction histidine kinase
MAVDITDRKQAEQALRAAQERELRAREEFTVQLLQAEEQERQHLAAELHDGLGQNLSVIKNKAYWALTQNGVGAPMREALTTISQAATQAIDEVRQLVRNLHPLQLQQRGLSDSLQNLVEAVAQSSAVHFEWRIENVDEVLSGDAATHLYRIVQEALNNLVTHSGATSATLHLERDIHCIRLRVTDDGAGFDPDHPSPHAGYGLTSMTQRARMLGGGLQIESAPGSGTRLVLELPINEGN